MRILLKLTLLLVTSVLADDHAVTVYTPSGKIKGVYKKSQYGKRFESYEGIPYAKPPVGDLRFKPPERIDPWDHELDGTQPGSECLQYLILYDDPLRRVNGTEDCLYLNVYTRSQFAEKLLPVFFVIHGGSFQYGSGAGQAPPDYIMNKDIVLVTINYRLGPLGFLSTEDDVVSGNMGLKDQVLALEWVSKNIRSFGGDPHSVTLFGQSAGAASVHYHYLSPMSRDLFHRGISLSGTAFNCWSQTEASLEKAKKLGALLGCSTDTNEDLIDCLRECSADDIMGADPKFMGWLYNPDVPFGPVVEKNATKPFISKAPIDVIIDGEVADLPWITTVVSEEGLYTAAQFINDDDRLNELNNTWDSIAPHLLDYNFTIPRSQHAAVARKIRDHYLGNATIDRDTGMTVVHLMGDRLYVVDAEKSARLQAEMVSSPIRMYYFDYRGEFSLTDAFTGTMKNFGVSHADDEFYVFPGPDGTVKWKRDLEMSEYMVNLWVSFATTGTPEAGIDWVPVDPWSKALRYLHIAGPNQRWIEENVDFGRKDFWKTIDFNENKPSNESAAVIDFFSREHRSSTASPNSSNE